MKEEIEKSIERKSIAPNKTKTTIWDAITYWSHSLDNKGVFMQRLEWVSGFFPDTARSNDTYFIKYNNVISVVDLYQTHLYLN